MGQNDNEQHNNEQHKALVVSKLGMLSDGRKRVFDVLPKRLQAVVLEMEPEWVGASEHELEKIVEADATLNRIRLSFWREMDRATAEVRPFKLANVALGVGIPSAHVMGWLTFPERLAWVLCPPAAYDAILDEAVTHGLNRLRNEVLGMDIRNEDGSVNVKKAELLLKAIAFVDLRKHGSIVQNTRNENLNLYASAKDMRKVNRDIELKELDAEIQKLEEMKVIELAERAVREKQPKTFEPFKIDKSESPSPSSSIDSDE